MSRSISISSPCRFFILCYTVLLDFLSLVFALIRVRKHCRGDIPKSSVMDCVLAESYVK